MLRERLVGSVNNAAEDDDDQQLAEPGFPPFTLMIDQVTIPLHVGVDDVLCLFEPEILLVSQQLYGINLAIGMYGILDFGGQLHCVIRDSGYSMTAIHPTHPFVSDGVLSTSYR